MKTVKIVSISLALVLMVFGVMFLNSISLKKPLESMSAIPRKIEMTPGLAQLLKVEKSLISENDLSGFRLVRKDYRVEVTAPNGQKKVFEGISPKIFMGQDNSDEAQNWYGDYFLIENIKNPKGLLFFVEYYEGIGFAFIDETGTEIPIKHYPFFSPSGNKIAVVNFSETFDFDGWQVLEKLDGKFLETASLVDRKWKDKEFYSLEFDRWSDDENKIYLQVGFQQPIPTGSANKFVYYDGRLELVDKKWSFFVDDSTPVPYRRLPFIKNELSRRLFFYEFGKIPPSSWDLRKNDLRFDE